MKSFSCSLATGLQGRRPCRAPGPSWREHAALGAEFLVVEFRINLVARENIEATTALRNPSNAPSARRNLRHRCRITASRILQARGIQRRRNDHRLDVVFSLSAAGTGSANCEGSFIVAGFLSPDRHRPAARGCRRSRASRWCASPRAGRRNRSARLPCCRKPCPRTPWRREDRLGGAAGNGIDGRLPRSPASSSILRRTAAFFASIAAEVAHLDIELPPPRSPRQCHSRCGACSRRGSGRPWPGCTKRRSRALVPRGRLYQLADVLGASPGRKPSRRGDRPRSFAAGIAMFHLPPGGSRRGSAYEPLGHGRQSSTSRITLRAKFRSRSRLRMAGLRDVREGNTTALRNWREDHRAASPRQPSRAAAAARHPRWPPSL